MNDWVEFKGAGHGLPGVGAPIQIGGRVGTVMGQRYRRGVVGRRPDEYEITASMAGCLPDFPAPEISPKGKLKLKGGVRRGR